MIGKIARHRVDELMDSPSLAPHEHVRALEGLVTINRLSLTAEILLPKILALAQRLNRDNLTVLDVACGAGDVPLALYKMAARRGVRLDMTLADRSGTALAQALKMAGPVALTLVQCDADSEDLPQADIVTSSLFLHHLDGPDVVRVLRHLSARAGHLLLISDLSRTWSGLGVAWATCRLLSSSKIVRFDGPASVRAAWTPGEMRRMCHEAGLASAAITRIWPWRMLIDWRKIE